MSVGAEMLQIPCYWVRYSGITPSQCPSLPMGLSQSHPPRWVYLTHDIIYFLGLSFLILLPMSLTHFLVHHHHLRDRFRKINLKLKSSPSIVWHHDYLSLRLVNCSSLSSIKLRLPVTPIQRSILRCNATEHSSNSLPLQWLSDGW